MTSVIQIVENANHDLYAGRAKVSKSYESDVEHVWMLHSAVCDEEDGLIIAIKNAFLKKKSNEKIYVPGLIEEYYILKNPKYVPSPQVAPLYQALKDMKTIHSSNLKTLQREWEKIVTFDVLAEYHRQKNAAMSSVYDDDIY